MFRQFKDTSALPMSALSGPITTIYAPPLSCIVCIALLFESDLDAYVCQHSQIAKTILSVCLPFRSSLPEC